MIEQYMEKDILRQVKVVEYLFELKKIRITDLAKLLSVSRITIKRDITNILNLESRIKVVFENASIIEVSFWKEATRYQLIKKIYNQSKFLRVCSLYLLGQTNYIKIVEKEYISVAQAFNLKKKVENFFIENKIMTKHKEFIEDEFQYRKILLSILMRTDMLYDQVDHAVFKQAQSLAKNITTTFHNKLHEREFFFFQLVIYLSFKRQKYNMVIPEIEMKTLKEAPLFYELKKILDPYNLGTNEVGYIVFMYRLLDQNLSNYHYILMEYQDLRKNRIEKTSELTELIYIFENKFKKTLLHNIMFEKSIIRLVKSIFFDRHLYLVENHHFLNEKQRELAKEVESILKDWASRHQLILKFPVQAIDKFCLQVSGMLINDYPKKWTIFIVAEDEFSHIAYREWIYHRINEEIIIIDNILYYSLEDLPVYVDLQNSIIISERSLMYDIHQQVKQVPTFPVSLLSITEDLYKLVEFIFTQ